jgi:hypothetical protein
LRAEWGVAAACAAFVVFALNFASFTVKGDGYEYYSFVRRLFGQQSSATATGYNFGVGLLNAPFYGFARLVTALVAAAPFKSLEKASIAFASIFWVLVAAIMTGWLLARLRLPYRGLAVAAAILGTPVYYYGSFSPSYSHAADAAALTLAVAALYKAMSGTGPRWSVITGAAFGLAIAVRPANVGVLAGACLVLAVYREFRKAATIILATALTFAALVSVPLALGTSLVRWQGVNILTVTTGFSPWSPLKMLFTLHRGLFLWTPVTALAVVGAALALRRAENRRYLLALTAGTAGLWLFYADVKTWDGGFAFSARFLAAPVAFYAVGIGSLLRSAHGWLRPVAVAATVLGIAWALFIGMNHSFGEPQRAGVDTIVGQFFDGKRTLARFGRLTWTESHLRKIIDRVG